MYAPLEGGGMHARKVVVLYTPEKHEDLVGSLRRRVQRDLGVTIPAKDLGMLLKPVELSKTLYARAVEHVFVAEPEGFAKLLAVESSGTFDGKLRPRKDAGGAREDWVKQSTTDLEDIMRDATEAQDLLVETFSTHPSFAPRVAQRRPSIEPLTSVVPFAPDDVSTSTTRTHVDEAPDSPQFKAHFRTS